MFSGRLVEPAI